MSYYRDVFLLNTYIVGSVVIAVGVKEYSQSVMVVFTAKHVTCKNKTY